MSLSFGNFTPECSGTSKVKRENDSEQAHYSSV